MTDSGEARASVVVVANPPDSAELSEMLETVGFAVVWSGDGGDDTLQRIGKEPPDVVVLCSALDHGDARALAGAIRDSAPGVGLVLVGEQDGPIRNALDALDFEVDRFVGRPLSAKALRFAVRSATRAREAAQATPLTDELAVRLAQATDTAIDDFVRDAMDALPHVEASAAAAARAVAPPDPAAEGGTSEAEPAPAPEPEHDLQADTQPPASPLSIAHAAPGVATPPAREPTLILSDGGMSSVEAAPPPVAPVEQPAEEGLEDVFEAVPAVARPEDPTVPQPAPSSDLARALREKMSAMAERLFPGLKDSAAGALQMDAHAEIDLTSIGTDGPMVDFADKHDSADTFADAAFAAPQPHRDEVDETGSSPELRGEIELDAERRGDETSDATGEVTGATTHRRRSVGVGAQRGTIGAHEEDVASLFARLSRAAFTGRVALRAEAEKAIHFDEGRPIFATSNLPHDRMGDLLYREGKITRSQHARSREVVAESGRRMGEILVEMGFLKRRELLPAVRRHIEDVIYSVFAWDSGDYSCIPGDPARGEKIRLSRHPAALIVEGVRRKYGLDLLEVKLGSPDTVVEIVDRNQLAALLKELDLGQAERRAIHQLDGDKTLRRVSQAADVDLLSVYQIAFALVVLGVAEAAGEGVDTGVLRERSPSIVGATDLAIDRERVLAKHALVDDADYFMLLGVRRDASSFEIQRAYEAARRDFSDDVFPYELRSELTAELEDINLLLDEAFEVLRDDALRESYKANLLD